MAVALMYEMFRPEGSPGVKLSTIANTGNLVHIYAMTHLLNAKHADYRDNDFSQYSAVVTPVICWIKENHDISEWDRWAAAHLGNIPFIPLSIGLESPQRKPDFALHPQTAKFLAKLAEKAVIAVRGYYSAEILSKYGIKNLQVIGCPSLYLNLERGFAIHHDHSEPEKTVVNFSTFWRRPGNRDWQFLLWSARNNMSFVEQTMKLWNPCDLSGNTSAVLADWLKEKERIFLDVDEWRKYIREFDFSLGQRMHGNVIALWEGIPSLFLTMDARMEEMCEFFHLPCLSARDFDAEKPVEYYYELADYTEFIKHYPSCLKDFYTFLAKNHLDLSC